MPFSFSAVCVYFFRSLGANHSLPIQSLNSAVASLFSTLKGSKYRGRMILPADPDVITSVVSQKGQLSEVMFGFSVTAAPHPVHFTVDTVWVSAEASCLERN